MIKEPLRSMLGHHYHVEIQAQESMKPWVDAGGKLPWDINVITHQLREAIEQQLITPDEYEALTQLDFDTQEELTTYLRDCLHELEGWFPSKGG